MVFRDRSDAGRRLAAKLEECRDKRPLVLGLARGGMVIAAEIARSLGAQLDVLVARKVGAPDFPEFGIGAVGPQGARFFDPRSVAMLGLTQPELDVLADKEEAEVRRRLSAYRGDRATVDLAGRWVVIADDGLATGVTAVAAAEYVRGKNPARTVLAVPVCTDQASDLLRDHVDELVCLSKPPDFRSVGEWYDDFAQTTDQEVMKLMAHAKAGGYLA